MPDTDPPSLKDGSKDEARRITPSLNGYSLEGIARLGAEIGDDVPVERVISPDLQDAIDRQAYDLCESTNATTDLEISEAYRRVKQQIATGLIAQGEGLPLLTKRIAEIFARAEGYRARRIAQTEAARAFHQALETTAKETGAVEGWRWLAAGDACPICSRIAREVGEVKLGHAFAVTSDNPIYGRIPHPPAHPGCNCTMEAVLIPEFRAPGDTPSYGAPLDLRPGQEPIAPPKEEPEGTAEPGPKPDPVAKPKPPPKPVETEDDDDWLDLTDPEEIKPPKPKPIAPPPTPSAPIEPPPPQAKPPEKPVVTAPMPEPPKPAGRAILPGAPIQERLAAYTEGDAKVAALQEVWARKGARLEVAERERERAREEFMKLSRQYISATKPKDIARLKPLAEAAEKRLFAAIDAAKAIKEDPADKAEILKILKAKDPISMDLAAPTGGKLEALSPEVNTRRKKAQDWLESVTSRADADEFRAIEIGQLPGGAPGRAQFDISNRRVVVGSTAEEDTMVHELAHALDACLVTGGRRAGRSGVEFLNYRVGDEEPVPLKQIFRGSGYREDERGRKDNFEAAFGESAWYVGKDYGLHAASEIVSMGVEELYNDAARFAAKDPEYCKFILGYLDGSLR